MAKYTVNHPLIAQALKFGAVGILSNGAGYLAYLLLTSLQIAPWLSMSMLYACVSVIGFFGNRSFSFRSQGMFSREAVRYVIMQLSGFCINYAMLAFFYEKLGYAHEYVQLCAIGVVAIYSFIMMKFIVFRAPT